VAPSVIYFLFVVCFFVFFQYRNILFIVNVLIELETDPSHVRPAQALELINDFSFWGSGLGAGLSSGYSRDELGYGFELSFHNIIHKFGVFSIFPLATIFVPMAVSAFNLMRGRNIIINTSAFSLMLYVIPAYGNPIVFASFNVLLNCVALYLVAHPGREHYGK
jgi:hypothetical protein